MHLAARLLPLLSLIALAQSVPSSPCPAVFSYIFEEPAGWYGVITILPPAKYSEVQVVLTMTVPFHRPEKGVGKLDIRGGDAELDAISQRAYRGEQHQIQFQVVFPPHNNDYEVPRIKNIVINGQSFCLNNQVYPDTKGVIDLKYTMKTGVILPVAPGNQFSTVRANLNSNPVSWEIPSTQPPILYQPSPVPPTSLPIPYQPSPVPPISQPIAYQPSTVPPTPSPRPTTTTTTASYEQYLGNIPVGGEEEKFQVNGLNCGVAKAQHNFLVLGGTEARVGQWPWQAAMFRTTSQGLKFICGGTLISKRHVISAAHCVYLDQQRKTVKTDSVLIYLGKHNLRSFTEKGQQAKDVDRIIVHPNYPTQDNKNYDVAILILSTAAEFTKYVIPACLWDRSTSLNEIIDTPGSVAGWGLDDSGEIANVLMTAKMPVVSQETCLRSGEFYTTYTSDVTFCAGYNNGTSACNGDSGGGMFFLLDNPKQQTRTWYTRGVVSLSQPKDGENVCDSFRYIVFTDLAKMMPWLLQQLVPPAD